VSIEEWMLAAAASPWVYLVTALLVIADAFLVIVPSETVVVALGSLALSTGTPNVWLLVAVAALSAAIGDNLCFLIGRRLGVRRFAWMRRASVASAVDRAGRMIEKRAASVILTARYIPFARIAANLAAGATGFSYRRYLPLTIVAGLGWAVFNVVVGAAFGAVFQGNPVLAVAASVGVAACLGVLIDAVVARTGAALRPGSPERDPGEDGGPPLPLGNGSALNEPTIR